MTRIPSKAATTDQKFDPKSRTQSTNVSENSPASPAVPSASVKEAGEDVQDQRDQGAKVQKQGAKSSRAEIQNEQPVAEDDQARTFRQHRELVSAARQFHEDAKKTAEKYIGWKWNDVLEAFGMPDDVHPGEWYFRGWDKGYGMKFLFSDGEVIGIESLEPEWRPSAGPKH